MNRKSTFVIVGVIVSLLAGVLNGQTAVQIHAASSTAVAGWRQMASPGGDAIWVAPESRLTSADIARAEARTLPGGDTGVAIVMTDAGAAKMADLSKAQASKPIALILDGQVIWAPIVRGSIQNEALLTGGPGGLTKAQIDRLIASFK